MSHDYDVFTTPATTDQTDPESVHDQAVRTQFARELAVMLREQGQDYAATLVRYAPTDGQWP
mgnify:CR=1 FL=1